mmetsp:Transcript_53304/g.155290  ORF Transcript_53304/g.155290 Transcript_53304/m.155290 type:complete len:273 (+) Transcript_53304:290-1108(+)
MPAVGLPAEGLGPVLVVAEGRVALQDASVPAQPLARRRLRLVRHPRVPDHGVPRAEGVHRRPSLDLLRAGGVLDRPHGGLPPRPVPGLAAAVRLRAALHKEDGASVALVVDVRQGDPDRDALRAAVELGEDAAVLVHVGVPGLALVALRVEEEAVLLDPHRRDLQQVAHGLAHGAVVQEVARGVPPQPGARAEALELGVHGPGPGGADLAGLAGQRGHDRRRHEVPDHDVAVPPEGVQLLPGEGPGLRPRRAVAARGVQGAGPGRRQRSILQ